MPDKTVKQALSMEIEFAQESIDKAFKLLDQLGEKAVETTKQTKKATEQVGGLSDKVNKDLKSAFGSIEGALGPLAGIAGAAGPIAAATAAFVLLDNTQAALVNTMNAVNQQFVGFKENVTTVREVVNSLNSMGYSPAESQQLISGLSRTGAFKNEKELNQAVLTSAAASKVTGIPVGDMSSLVSNLILQGGKGGGIDASKIPEELPKKLADFGTHAAESGMALSQYTKTVDDVWKASRNLFMSFETAETVVKSWSEEVRRGIFSAQQVADFSAGKGMTESAQLFMADRMHLSGSPLEMITEFQRKLGTGEGQAKIKKTIKEMAVDLAPRSEGAQLQLIQKFAQQFAPSLGIKPGDPTSLRQAEDLLYGKKSPLTADQKKTLAADAKERGEELNTSEKLQAKAIELQEQGIGIFKQILEVGQRGLNEYGEIFHFMKNLATPEGRKRLDKEFPNQQKYPSLDEVRNKLRDELKQEFGLGDAYVTVVINGQEIKAPPKKLEKNRAVITAPTS